jgi:hypothetical protein
MITQGLSIAILVYLSSSPIDHSLSRHHREAADERERSLLGVGNPGTGQLQHLTVTNECRRLRGRVGSGGRIT